MASKSWHLDRRTFLRGMGVAAAAPYLEGMTRTASARGASTRLCVVYFPNGCSLPDENDKESARWRWFPRGEGRDFEFTEVLRSLRPLQQKLAVYGGLSHPKSRELLGHMAGDTFLTAGDVRGDAYRNSISLDQVAARELGKHTRYASLALSTDGGVGYKSRVSTLSFDGNGKPIPSEHRPRQIFERYFAPDGGAMTEARQRSLSQGKKVVDLVLDDSKQLQRRLGARDQRKLEDYLAALNAVEEQIRRNETWLAVPMKPFDASQLELDRKADVDPAAYLRSMFDLITLAFQTDLTRVVTFMMGREDGMGFGDNFPNLALGIKKSHHTISHDNEAGHWEEWGRFDQWFADQFGYFVNRLDQVEGEDGKLLDRSLVLYGGCCSTTHNARNLPLALVGGGGLGVPQGEYRRFGEDVPLSNLYLGMLGALGVEAASFGDSTGVLDGFRV